MLRVGMGCVGEWVSDVEWGEAKKSLRYIYDEHTYTTIQYIVMISANFLGALRAQRGVGHRGECQSSYFGVF